MSDRTASEVHYEQVAMGDKARLLKEHPEIQADVIAQHYVRHATLALNLQRLVRDRAYGDFAGDPDTAYNLDALIRFHVSEIKRGHKFDFGLALEWPNEPK